MSSQWWQDERDALGKKWEPPADWTWIQPERPVAKVSPEVDNMTAIVCVQGRRYKVHVRDLCINHTSPGPIAEVEIRGLIDMSVEEPAPAPPEEVETYDPENPDVPLDETGVVPFGKPCPNCGHTLSHERITQVWRCTNCRYMSTGDDRLDSAWGMKRR